MTTATKNNAGNNKWLFDEGSAPKVVTVAPVSGLDFYVSQNGQSFRVVENMENVVVSSGGSVGSFPKAIHIVLRNEVEHAMWHEFRAWDEASDEDMLEFDRGSE